MLKAHRLKDTATFGKQDLYLKLTAGSNSQKSDVHKGEHLFALPAWHACHTAPNSVTNDQPEEGQSVIMHATRLELMCYALCACADAGTDCALGETFNIEVPAGVEAVQLEVFAKHSLTGDDHIGTATISLEAVKVCIPLGRGGGAKMVPSDWLAQPSLTDKMHCSSVTG